MSYASQIYNYCVEFKSSIDPGWTPCGSINEAEA